MKRRTAIKAITEATAVYGYIRLTDNDGQYIRLVKKDVLKSIRDGMGYEIDVDCSVSHTGEVFLG